MARPYSKRIAIPLEGQKLALHSSTGVPLARAYTRIVIGGRGPYVEFSEDQLVMESFEIPKELEYRLTSEVVYYVEYRSKDDAYVKLYHQTKTVAYADYFIDMFYISPFDLFTEDGLPIIDRQSDPEPEEPEVIVKFDMSDLFGSIE